MNKTLKTQKRMLLDLAKFSDEIRDRYTLNHIRILVKLLDGPVPVGTVARWLNMEPSGVTRQVDCLEKRGLLVRSYDPKDRRVVIIEITGEGSKLVKSWLA